MSETVKSLFKKYQNKNFIFIKPGGNWGDELIYFGAEFLAESMNVSFKSYTVAEFLHMKVKPDTVVYIHGGGAFNSWCSDNGWACLKHAVQTSHVVIYAPCSVGDETTFLHKKFADCLRDNIASEIYIFARELKTFELLKNTPALAEVNVSKDIDTALHLTKQAVEDRLGKEKKSYDFYAFREDNEACLTQHEISYNHVILDPAKRCQSFEHWMRVHLCAKKIITNRTHSSVLGAVLGKETYLFAGSYHKNHSIWQESLQELGVKWLEQDEAIAQKNNGFLDFILPTRIKNSWRIRSAYLFMCGVPLT